MKRVSLFLLILVLIPSVCFGLNIDADSNDLVDVGYGGTNVGTLTDGGILIGAGTAAFEATAVGAAGEILVGVAAANPKWLVAGTATYWLVANGANDPVWTDPASLYYDATSSVQDQLNARQTTLTNEAGLYAALSDVSDFVQPDQKFTMGATIQETSGADTTPDVSTAATGVNNIYRSNANGTITDFDDGDDHSEFSDGDFFIFILDDTSVLNFNGNSDLNRPGNLDYTGSATQITVILFEYLDAAWHTTSLSPAATSPTTLSVGAIETPTLQEDEWNDEAGDRLLTVAEMKNKIISNNGQGALHFDAPATVTEGWSVIFIIETAANVVIDPASSAEWYLNGTSIGATSSISNTLPTVGESIMCYSTEALNVFCESKYADWVDADD